MNGPILLEPKSSTTENAKPEHAADATHATYATNATTNGTAPGNDSERKTSWTYRNNRILRTFYG